MNEPLKKSRKKVWLLAIAGIMAWVAVICLGAWLSLPFWAPKLAKSWLKGKNVDIDFDVTNSLISSTKLENIVVSSPDIKFEADRLFFMHPSEEWSETLLRSVHVHDFNLSIPLKAKKAKTEDSLNKLVESLTVPLPQIPIRKISAETGQVSLDFGNVSIIEVDANIFFNSNDGVYSLISEFIHSENSLHLSAKASSQSSVLETDINLQFRLHDVYGVVANASKAVPYLDKNLTPYLSPDTSISGIANYNRSTQILDFQTIGKRFHIPDTELNSILLFAQTQFPFDSVSGTVELPRATHKNLEIDFLCGRFDLFNFSELTPSLEMTIVWDHLKILSKTKSFSIPPAPIGVIINDRKIALTIEHLLTPDLPVGLSGIEIDVGILDHEYTFDLKTNPDSNLEGLVVSSPQEEIRINGSILKSFKKASGNLNLPASNIIWERGSHYLETNFVGDLDFGWEPQNTSLSADFQATDVSYSFSDTLNLNGNLELNASTQIQTKKSSEPASWVTFFEKARLDGNINLSGTWDDFLFSLSQFRMKNAEGTSGTSYQLEADTLLWDPYQVRNVSGKAELTANKVGFDLQGNSPESSLAVTTTGHYLFGNSVTELRAEVSQMDPNIRAQIPLHDWIPEFPTAFLSGLLETSSDMKFSEKESFVSLKLWLDNGNLTLPDFGIAASGIKIEELYFEDLIIFDDREPQEVFIAEITIPPAKVTTLNCSFRLVENRGIKIETFDFSFCSGKVTVKFLETISPPYDEWEAVVSFSGLEMAEVIKMIPDFKDELIAKMEGNLPVRYSQGKLSWGSGYAKLMEGQVARLRYADDGVFSNYLPEIVISEKLDLRIDELLRDVTLTELHLELRDSNSFGEPSVMIMSGQSNDPRIQIPIEKIQLNIRGADLPMLLNQSLENSQLLQSIKLRN